MHLQSGTLWRNLNSQTASYGNSGLFSRRKTTCSNKHSLLCFQSEDHTVTLVLLCPGLEELSVHQVLELRVDEWEHDGAGSVQDGSTLEQSSRFGAPRL